MIKIVANFSSALIFSILCGCVAASPPKSNQQTSNPSTGCGALQQNTLLKHTGNFMPRTIQVLDQARRYHLRVPSDYDPSRAYSLIFRWHGAGGNGLSGGLNIEYSAKNDAIIVSADGMNNVWDVKTGSADLAFFDNMLQTISSQYCIDNKRIFSYGFSVGGSFSNLLACERSDVLRASAAVASGLLSDACKGKVATWLLHDINDEVVPISKGKAVLERVTAANGCNANTADEGNGCVRYAGCDAAPVVWCESKGLGHDIRGDFAPAKVWQFFQQFD